MVLLNMLFGEETQFWVCKLSSNHAISNQFGIIVFQQLSPSVGIVSFFNLLFLSSLFNLHIFKLTVYIFLEKYQGFMDEAALCTNGWH